MSTENVQATMKIQAVVLSYNESACKPLGEWLHRNEIDWRYSARDHDDMVRNMAINRFLEEDVPNRNKTHLMLIDSDMVPVSSSAHILEANDKHCVFLGTVGPFGTLGHRGDGNFGENFCRMSAELLKRCHYPYFKTTYENGRRVQCDGHTLLQQVKVLGVPSLMVGIAGHMQSCVLLPANNKLGWQMTWPHLTDL